MFLTWTTLELAEPSVTCPWEPQGATFTQAGQAGAGSAEIPEFAGTWWSALSTWDDAALAAASAPRPSEQVRAAWHVTLQPASYRGDAVLSGGARPFQGLPA